MVARVVNTYSEYPRQFWVLFLGRLLSATGGSLIWPFMTIYLRQRFDIPLTTIGLLFGAWSVVNLAGTGIAGPFVDRVGRRLAMLVTMALWPFMWIALGLADSIELMALLFVIDAIFEPFFRTAADAMVVDLIAPERRSRAFALLRMVGNLGVAIGPAIGGFITTQSYFLAFMLAASADAIYFLITLIFIRETKPVVTDTGQAGGEGIGYGRLLRDYPFLSLSVTFTLVVMAYAQMMLFLSVYMKEVFGIPENQWGLILATNAAMVVLFQFFITRFMDRFRRGIALAWGALFTALGVGSVALGNSFPYFWGSMVIMTVGEMILIPTSQAYVADLAPLTMRGRYMGAFGLTWSVGFGLGPLLGGLLSDNYGGATIWYAGLLLGLASAIGFLFMAARIRPAVVPAPPLGSEVAET